MGVDFLVCHRCRDTFPDCGSYVSCESCGTHWCSSECAEEDGWTDEHCNKHPELDDRDKMEDYRYALCDHEDCCECDEYRPAGCNFCREDDYEEDFLLEKALALLQMTRSELVEKIKNNDQIGV